MGHWGPREGQPSVVLAHLENARLARQLGMMQALSAMQDIGSCGTEGDCPGAANSKPAAKPGKHALAEDSAARGLLEKLTHQAASGTLLFRDIRTVRLFRDMRTVSS